MNKTYRLIWNDFTNTWVAVAEIARARGNRAAIDWQTFNIGSAARVNFIQPSSSAAILNQREPSAGTRGTATL